MSERDAERDLASVRLYNETPLSEENQCHLELIADHYIRETLRLRDELKRVGEERAWRPIAEAPKDGTRMFLWKDGWPAAFVGQWRESSSDDVPDGWAMDELMCIPGALTDGFLGWQEEIDEGSMPTHFMPLPDAPALSTSESGGNG